MPSETDSADDGLDRLALALAPHRRTASPRRPEILDATLEVIVERGHEATRYRDVADRAGVAIATLQYLFGSREGLLVAAFEHGVRRDLAYLDALADTADPWHELGALVGAVVEDDAGLAGSRVVWIEFWRAATRDPALRPAAGIVYGLWRDRFAAAIERGVDQGVFRPVESVGAIITMLFATLDGAAIPITLGLAPDRARLSGIVRRWLASALGVAGPA